MLIAVQAEAGNHCASEQHLNVLGVAVIAAHAGIEDLTTESALLDVLEALEVQLEAIVMAHPTSSARASVGLLDTTEPIGTTTTLPSWMATVSDRPAPL